MTDDHDARFTHHGRAEWVVAGLVCIAVACIIIAIIIEGVT